MPFGWFKVMMIMFASCLMNMSIILCFWLLIVFSDLNFFVASFHLGVLFGKGVLWCGFPCQFRSKPQQRVHFWNCFMSPALRCWGSGEPGPLAQTSPNRCPVRPYEPKTGMIWALIENGHCSKEMIFEDRGFSRKSRRFQYTQQKEVGKFRQKSYLPPGLPPNSVHVLSTMATIGSPPIITRPSAHVFEYQRLWHIGLDRSTVPDIFPTWN